MCLISWERMQGTHINFFGGILGVKKGVRNRPFSATKSWVYCFFFVLPFFSLVFLLCLLGLFSQRNSLVFLSVFCLFSRVFKGSPAERNIWCTCGFPWCFRKDQGKEGQGVQPWGCSRARDIFGLLGLSGPRPKRLLAPSLIDFRGNPGIRALYQAIGIPIAVTNK